MPEPKLVTIAIPVYKRLEHLAQALACVRRQDYPNLEVIVSDNGENGEAVRKLVEECFPGPRVFRQNPRTVDIVDHLNLLIDCASGEYFVLLCDDDEISDDFVSELVHLMEEHPQAAVAVSRHQSVNAAGEVCWSEEANRPRRLTGENFLRAMTLEDVELASVVTHLSRTELLRRCGGYPKYPRGLYSDLALLVKLCLQGDVVLGQTSRFRWRVEESSTGFSAHYLELNEARRRFCEFLRDDAFVTRFAASSPYTWRDTRRCLHHQSRSFVAYVWKYIYQGRLPRWEWIKAGFITAETPSDYLYAALAVFGITSLTPMRRLLRSVFRPLLPLYRSVRDVVRAGSVFRKHSFPPEP